MMQTTKWDAGGLQAPADPPSGKPSTCFTTIVASPNSFKVVPWKANNGIFNCDPQNVVVIPEKLGEGTTLASVGKSLSDLK